MPGRGSRWRRRRRTHVWSVACGVVGLVFGCTGKSEAADGKRPVCVTQPVGVGYQRFVDKAALVLAAQLLHSLFGGVRCAWCKLEEQSIDKVQETRRLI